MYLVVIVKFQELAATATTFYNSKLLNILGTVRTSYATHKPLFSSVSNDNSTMSMFHLIFAIRGLLSVSCFIVAASWCPFHISQQTNQRFQQKTDQFWVFSQQTQTWVEAKLPYDLFSCVNGDCRKVGSILETEKKKKKNTQQVLELENIKDSYNMEAEEDVVLPQRKRISLTKISETSVWITGESGSIYERFWNGMEWVIVPHHLPESAGSAISVFVINQTILALSESGKLYQIRVQLSESSQSIWVEFTPPTVPEKNLFMKSGVTSHDGQRAYFCTKNGTLVELAWVEPPRWINHGQPAGANVAAIADAAASTREVVYTISSSGDLYEYDRKSKPSWKRHIWQEGTVQAAPLMPSKGCSISGLSYHSESLFLLTKEGSLVERRLHQRKWKWVVHGRPQNQNLTSVTPAALQDESSETSSISLFFTTLYGSVFEYRIPKQLGLVPDNQFPGAWKSHQHPLHAKAARGIAGLQLYIGRILFPLDDGRLAELHPLGQGGESSSGRPSQPRRKASTKYVWSLLDVPESEGWNAEYCTEERGLRNCLTGIKDESEESVVSLVTGKRKQSQTQNHYLSVGASGGRLIQSSEEYNTPNNWISRNFRLRLMDVGKSFFLITDDGLIFEYISIESAWIWLRHESSTGMKGILSNYNGSLFMVDTHGSLLLRERSGQELAWRNCTAVRKGRNVIGGQPWDGLPGQERKVTTEDTLFFVSKTGRLMKLMVSLKKLKWKDCRNPPDAKVACIVDQELFRKNIVFVIGRNGRLYQYNKLIDLWHSHYHSQHLVLSQFPGTVIRPSLKTLSGSLFMLSREGGLVEYQWSSLYGWNWVEHGTPSRGVTLVGSPGPSFEGNQLFLIGSDGKVYLRYMDKMAWKWKDCGFPYVGNKLVESHKHGGFQKQKVDCVDEDSASYLNKDQGNFGVLNIKCDSKVASTRPISFSEDSVLFELRDGRLAEIQLVEKKEWVWSRIIATPDSLCLENYWTTVAYNLS